MKTNICFLDMDGVLVAMSRAVIEAVGQEFDDVYPLGKQSSYGISGQLGFGDNLELWTRFDRRFWAEIPKTEEADDLVCLANDLFGIENVFVLSMVKPGIVGHEVASGKADWLLLHFPELYKRHIFTTDKTMSARRDAVLIDDHDGNADDFQEAGGKSIIFPRRWNRYWEESNHPMPLVEGKLRSIKGA